MSTPVRGVESGGKKGEPSVPLETLVCSVTPVTRNDEGDQARVLEHQGDPCSDMGPTDN